MNVLNASTRNWRKRPSRAVSPIIATILLVAVAVVLAAILYVLVSGLVHGPGSTPIGSAFAAGHPATSTCAAGSAQSLGASPISGGCKAGDFIYTLTVESSTVSLGSVLFVVKTASGGVYSGGSASSSFALIDVTNHVAALSVTGATMAMTTTWQAYGLTTTAPTYTPSSALTNLHIIVIDMGSASPTTGQGLKLVALGTGSFSGATGPLDLP
jgi:archaeal type IV pilus assembly protein PilA